MSRFQDTFFTVSAKEAAAIEYDIIVVGTGAGGGTIAANLFDTNFKLGDKRAPRILVIEKGDLLFHSHCLNSARPPKTRSPAQDNDGFFQQFKDNYNIQPKSSDWGGGPVYCLGGRSTVWGLFCPKVHDRTLDGYFPKQVAEDLRKRYYAEAESTIQLSIPATNQRHLRLIERLNIDETVSGRDVSWEWGRIASQFHHSSNYYFPEGAWSTVDRLLEIVMGKPEKKSRPNFWVLLQAEVRKVQMSSGKATGVVVRTTIEGGAGDITIKLRNRTSSSASQTGVDGPQTYTADVEPTVILCAGSVNSAAILLRSGISLDAGRHITDHDIFHTSRSFRYKDESVSRDIGGVKLQTYVTNLPSSPKETFLVNMAIDSSSFLPRGDQIRDKNLNTITLDKHDEPVVHMERASGGAQLTGGIYDDLQHITKAAMESMKEVLSIEWVPPPKDKPFWELLPLGGVAHELGSIPMPGPDGSGGCVDADLKLRNYVGIRVCDLSVFPVSPEVNPTLTLTALALRLTDSLMPPTGSLRPQWGVACVVNHSGQLIRLQVAQSWSERFWYRLPVLPHGVSFPKPRGPFPRPGGPQWPFIDSSDPREDTAASLVSRGPALKSEHGFQLRWCTLLQTPKDVYLEAGDAFVWTRFYDESCWKQHRDGQWHLTGLNAASPEPVLVWRVIENLPVGPESYIVTPGGPICAIPPLMIP
ncbi:hypothetical protein EIP86_003805 [Pleurotus ostreatoroseus]|nr:hypothetical protein EIP86_003805 [Pleurotus ostreatoroseus]